MVAPVKVGKGVVALLVKNGSLDQAQKNDRREVGEACLAALEQWASGRHSSEGTQRRPQRLTSDLILTPDLWKEPFKCLQKTT